MSSYYILDTNESLILKFNDNWEYVGNMNVSSPNYMISVNNEHLFITSDEGIIKMNVDLDLIQTYNSLAYIGICYNETNNTFMVVSNLLKQIDIFNLNLTIVDTISLSKYSPWSIEKNNNKLYVGTITSEILVIENKVILQKLEICMGVTSFINSILIDQYDYMAVVCGAEDVLHLYYTNGSWVGISWVVYSTPEYIGYDSNGRFVFIMTNELRTFQQNF